MKNALAIGLLMFVVLVMFAVQTAARRWLAVIILGLATLILMMSFHFARAHDLGQWENSDPTIREWYQSLMRPDAPSASCCGEADAYWADEVHVRGGKTFAVITDDRDDAPRGRPHVAVGTEIEIPDHKLKWDRSNPTGHAIVFLSRGGFVYCFVQGSGI
jgi:hypothetical protein